MTAFYRALIIAGGLVLITSASERPDIAMWGLASLALGAFIRSEKWRAAYLDEVGELAGAQE